MSPTVAAVDHQQVNYEWREAVEKGKWEGVVGFGGPDVIWPRHESTSRASAGNGKPERNPK